MTAPLTHEWDAPPGSSVHTIRTGLRVVVWAKCARCGQAAVGMADLGTLLVPEAQQAMVEEAQRELAKRLGAGVCSGPAHVPSEPPPT